LEAFELWGVEKTLKKCNGMFAFAIWDKKEKKIYLGRDRIGIKPLYFGFQNNMLFFGSELKSIRKNIYFSPEIDKEALALFFKHNYIPTPYSIYKNIQKLLPAHYMVINRNFDSSIHCYWDIQKISENGFGNPIDLSEREAIDKLENLLLDSVKKRMISDVPLGAFLSGGIDSSTIVALMQSQSKIPIKTFTIGFEEKKYNEAKYAKRIANYLGTDHTELYITPKAAIDVIPMLPNMYDEPFSDSSQIPTYLISKLTRKYVTVSLSGDGGDELFTGYNRYFKADKFYHLFKPFPPSIRKLVGKFIPLLSANAWQGIGNMIPVKFRLERFGDRMHKFAELFNFSSPLEFYSQFVSHTNNPEALLKKKICGLPSSFIEKYKAHTLTNFIDQMTFIDLITYLPDDILTKVDRASMYVSLEARVPILDHRIVEFSRQIPLFFKVKNETGKIILRKILYKYLPKEFVERPKKGFSVPIGEWLKGPLRSWTEELLNEKKIKEDGIISFAPIQKLWKEHLTNQRDWKYLLWNILMFQAWKEKWM
jgi:asparagine synthase (glutamine-hydrolysing)